MKSYKINRHYHISPCCHLAASLVSSKLVFCDLKETAVKSSNGSVEMRAQGGKSGGRGAAEGSDTHLSGEWTHTGRARAKMQLHKLNPTENRTLKGSWRNDFFSWSFPLLWLLPCELTRLFSQVPVSRQASTAQHTSSSQAVMMLTVDAKPVLSLSRA